MPRSSSGAKESSVSSRLLVRSPEALAFYNDVKALDASMRKEIIPRGSEDLAEAVIHLLNQALMNFICSAWKSVGEPQGKRVCGVEECCGKVFLVVSAFEPELN